MYEDILSALLGMQEGEEEGNSRFYGDFERMMMGQPGEESYEEGGGNYMAYPTEGRSAPGVSKAWNDWRAEMSKYSEWKKQRDKQWDWWSQL